MSEPEKLLHDVLQMNRAWSLCFYRSQPIKRYLRRPGVMPRLLVHVNKMNLVEREKREMHEPVVTYLWR